MVSFPEYPDTLSELKEICERFGVKPWGSKEQIKKRLKALSLPEENIITDTVHNYANYMKDALKALCEEKIISNGK